MDPNCVHRKQDLIFYTSSCPKKFSAVMILHDES